MNSQYCQAENTSQERVTADFTVGIFRGIVVEEGVE